MAQNLMKKEIPRNLYVGSLHYDINDNMLRRIFEPFGDIEKLEIQRDGQGKSKGYAFIVVSLLLVCAWWAVLISLCYLYSLETLMLQSGPKKTWMALS